MRSFIVASALAGLALASPVPQDIDFGLAYAVPDPSYATDALTEASVTAQTVTYNTEAILTSAIPQITSSIPVTATTNDAATYTGANKVKRTACAPQPTGAGPVPSPDTASAFLADTDIINSASAAPVPSGYTQMFSNLQASNNAYGYMGYTTLQTYDTVGCAAQCNKINGCLSVNIYFERDPSVDPGSGCDNPSSTTNIKCVFWGGPVTSSNANNAGQWRDNFQVVIAGSNGYTNNSIVPVAGYSTATDLGNAAINAPLDKYGYNTYMGSALFNSGPFDAGLCAQACTAKSNYNLAHPPTDGSPVQTCQFFNTYILYINTTKNLQGQYCAMYSEAWASSYATNVGQYYGNDHFLIEYSYSFTNTTNAGSPDPNAAAHQASRDISYSTLQPFCSTYLGYSIPSTTVVTTTTVTPVSTSTTYTTETVSVQAGEAVAYGKLKRAVSVSTPAALTNYPASILSSACSMQASAPTVTSTITSVAITTASPSIVLTTVDTTTTTTLAASPTVIPASSAVCPADDDTIVTDSNGVQYVVGCSRDTYGPASAIVRTDIGFTDCFAACSTQSVPQDFGKCIGFMFFGDSTATNGVGSGVCYYLYTHPNGFTDQTYPNYDVGAIMPQYYGIGSYKRDDSNGTDVQTSYVYFQEWLQSGNTTLPTASS